MKKKRHIEITAVRRRITVVTSDVPAASLCGEPPQNTHEEIWSTLADLLNTNQADSIHGQLQSAPSPEIRRPVDTQDESNGDIAIEAKQLAPGWKEFFMKLRRVWRLSFRHLKNNN